MARPLCHATIGIAAPHPFLSFLSSFMVARPGWQATMTTPDESLDH